MRPSSLADGDAFRIFDAVEVASPVVFTTAYDRYALEAFRVNSIDYLLKPINTADVRRALDKLRRLTGGERAAYGSSVWSVSSVRSSGYCSPSCVQAVTFSSRV